jgi:hypothetical protein
VIRTLSRFAIVAIVCFAVAYAGRRLFAKAEVAKPVSVGKSLPLAIVHTAEGDARPYDRYLDRTRSTTLIVFSAQCSQCQAEAIEWQELANTFASRIAVVGVACTTDYGYPGRLAAKARITIPILICDDEFPKRIGATGLPTIYVLSPDRRVLFSEAGTDATADLKRWLGK